MKAVGCLCLVSLCVLPASAFPQVRPGDIQITCPPGINVYLDGRPMGLSSEQEDGKYLRAVPPGRHEIRLELAGFLPYSRVVDVAPGRVLEMRVTQLRPDVTAVGRGAANRAVLSADLGTLVVRCAPIRCTFRLLNRMFSNDTTAYQELSNLPVGSHAITFQRRAQILRGTVTVERGRTREILGDFLSGTITDMTAQKDSARAAFFGEWQPTRPSNWTFRLLLSDGGPDQVRVAYGDIPADHPADRVRGGERGIASVSTDGLSITFSYRDTLIGQRYANSSAPVIVDCVHTITLGPAEDQANKVKRCIDVRYRDLDERRLRLQRIR